MNDEAKYPISSADDRTPGVHVFEGEQSGEFFWHVIAYNGHICAIGGEAFTSAEHAWEGVEATTHVLFENVRKAITVFNRQQRESAELLTAELLKVRGLFDE